MVMRSLIGSPFLLPLSALALLSTGSGCGGSAGGGGDTAETSTSSDATGEEGETSVTSAETSGNDDTSTAGDGDGDGDGDSYCEDMALPVAEMQAAGDLDWGEVAGDFTVNTTFGGFTLSEAWTGCDSYVVVHDLSDGDSTALFNTAYSELFTNSARNVHYLFVNDNPQTAERAAQWEAQIGASIGGLASQEDIDWWAGHVHFVTDAPADIQGSLGAFLVANPTTRGVGIDRGQRWDALGSHHAVTSTFVPHLPVFGYVSRWYNWRHELDLALADTDGVTVVPMIDKVEFAPDAAVGEPGFDTQNGPFSNSNNNQVWTSTFPSAAEMANFDTMQIVVSATCGPDNYADCGHWDYEALIDLCSDDQCSEVVGEVGRWITPYARPGRRTWVIEASPMLGLLSAGGDQFFRFSMIWNMNPSTWDIHFRLSDEGGAKPTETHLAWRQNSGFNADYNALFAPYDFTPPAGTTRVELVSIISGHGQDTGNCAEWCYHSHDFTVNGSAVHNRSFTGDVENWRCAEAVDEGVVPGQYGNWTPGRAGWCPGQPVQPWVVDITDDVNIGESNTLEYQGTYAGGEPSAHGRIRIGTYVAYYAD
jgi:hypothetical protein